MWAACHSMVGVASKLLEQGAELNAQNAMGQNALWWACQSGKFDVAELLILQGADIIHSDNVSSSFFSFFVASSQVILIERSQNIGQR